MFMVQCKSQGQKSWMGYSPWGRKESDTAECLSMQVVPAANFKKKKKSTIFQNIARAEVTLEIITATVVATAAT